jgi:acyl-CoA oxidase
VASDGTYRPTSRARTPLLHDARRARAGPRSLDGAATTGTALALYIALTYANQRRQFDSGSGSDEVVLLDYGKHQRRLLPCSPRTTRSSSNDELLRKFDGVFSGRTDTPRSAKTSRPSPPRSSPCRRGTPVDRAGGARGVRRLGLPRREPHGGPAPDLDVYVTFEGDNNILLQLVGKRLLADYARQFKGADAAKLARSPRSRPRQGVPRCGPARLGQAVADFGSTARSVELGCAPSSSTSCSRARRADDLRHRGRLRPAAAAEAADLFNANQAELIEAAARTASCCSGRRSATASRR